MNNMIPSPWAEGSFTAIPPYDKVCDPKTFYKVQALRTVDELNQDGANIQKMVYDPVGIAEAAGNAASVELTAMKGLIVTLTTLNGAPIHIPSNQFKSFPLIDGVKYERVCLYIDLGVAPPTLKNSLNVFKDEVAALVKSRLGLTESRVNLGTIQTRGYVSQDQADAFEIARQLNIEDSPTASQQNETLRQEQIEDRAYIKVLENKIAELSAMIPDE